MESSILAQKEIKSYVHKEIGEEISSISGHMTILEENRFDYQGRDVLCVICAAVVDNSCCGVYGCLFVEVPGYVLSDNRGKSENAPVVSKVVPITGREAQEQISAALNRIYPYSQIYFG